MSSFSVNPVAGPAIVRIGAALPDAPGAYSVIVSPLKFDE
jgi:hypothetical protein